MKRQEWSTLKWKNKFTFGLLLTLPWGYDFRALTLAFVDLRKHLNAILDFVITNKTLKYLSILSQFKKDKLLKWPS